MAIGIAVGIAFSVGLALLTGGASFALDFIVDIAAEVVATIIINLLNTVIWHLHIGENVFSAIAMGLGFAVLGKLIAVAATKLGLTDMVKVFVKDFASNVKAKFIKPKVIVKYGDEAHSAFKYSLLKKDLKYTEKFGLDARRVLPDGRIRYYDEIIPASKTGTMQGRRLVQELNPLTGNVRTWHETLDHAGRIRQVRPQLGLDKVHYRFDELGSYIGSW
jgi:hypothetical protein